MTKFDDDDLPPDLSDLGRRMRDERPVAEDGALDRMMQRVHAPSRKTPRRAPRRAFAVSLATMLAMVSVTGVAAAALFGMSFPFLGNGLTNSTQQSARRAARRSKHRRHRRTQGSRPRSARPSATSARLLGC